MLGRQERKDGSGCGVSGPETCSVSQQEMRWLNCRIMVVSENPQLGNRWSRLKCEGWESRRSVSSFSLTLDQPRNDGGEKELIRVFRFRVENHFNQPDVCKMGLK